MRLAREACPWFTGLFQQAYFTGQPFSMSAFQPVSFLFGDFSFCSQPSTSKPSTTLGPWSVVFWPPFKVQSWMLDVGCWGPSVPAPFSLSAFRMVPHPDFRL